MPCCSRPPSNSAVGKMNPIHSFLLSTQPHSTCFQLLLKETKDAFTRTKQRKAGQARLTPPGREKRRWSQKNTKRARVRKQWAGKRKELGKHLSLRKSNANKNPRSGAERRGRPSRPRGRTGSPCPGRAGNLDKTVATTKSRSPTSPQAVPDREKPPVPPRPASRRQRHPHSRDKQVCSQAPLLTFPPAAPTAAMFLARARDDVALPHVSPRLTTTSGKTLLISGRKGGGEWRERRGAKGRGERGRPTHAC